MVDAVFQLSLSKVKTGHGCLDTELFPIFGKFGTKQILIDFVVAGTVVVAVNFGSGYRYACGS